MSGAGKSSMDHCLVQFVGAAAASRLGCSPFRFGSLENQIRRDFIRELLSSAIILVVLSTGTTNDVDVRRIKLIWLLTRDDAN
jgi:hypothetical protein